MKATYGTGVFVLAHVGDEVPEAGGRPAAHRRVADRRAGRVCARRRRVRGRRDARVAVPRAGRGRGPAGARGARARGGGLGRRAGAAGARRPRRAVVAARGACRARRAARRHDARRTWPAPRSRGSPGGWRTSWPPCGRPWTWRTLRVDGGLTNEPLLLELQADAIGVPVEAGRRRRHRGRARPRWPPWARASIPSLAEAAELLPVDRRVEPRARRRLALGGARALADVRAAAADLAADAVSFQAGAPAGRRRRGSAARRFSLMPMPSSNSICRTGPGVACSACRGSTRADARGPGRRPRAACS